MDSYIVYKHTTPSNKVYIGITCKSANTRWRNGAGYITNEHFYNAIKKYGWDNIKHEILYKNLTKKDACEKEIELIKKYKSTNNDYGYNNSTGGEYGSSGRILSKESKKKISDKLKGIKRTKEQCENISEAHIGLKHSEQQKQKIKQSNIGKHKGFLNGRSRAVSQYNLNGDYIQTFDYTRKASEERNICRQSIIKCCKGIYNQAGGYKWKYCD